METRFSSAHFLADRSVPKAKAQPCRYCGTPLKPKQCPLYSKACGSYWKINHFKAYPEGRQTVQESRSRSTHVIQKKMRSAGTTLMRKKTKSRCVNIRSLSFDSIRSVFVSKLETRSRQKRSKSEYKIGRGGNGNLMPFNIFKIYFPREPIE